MGFDTMEIGVYIRKSLIFCYRSVSDHPFVLGMLFFFIFLYRYFPSVFSFLVSFSPVLVCTAILLGALLSFDIPEVESGKKTHEIASLKVGVVEDDHFFEKDDSLSVETHVVRGRDMEEKAVEKESVTEENDTKGSDVEKDDVYSISSHDGLVGRTVVIEEELKEIHRQKEVIEEEEEREINNTEFVEKREFYEEKPLIDGVSGAGKEAEDLPLKDHEKEIENLKEELYKFAGIFPDAHLEDHFNSSRNSSWKQVEDNVESSDSGSDSEESSSPDASIDDITPMLDELHPLLDSSTLHSAIIAPSDSDAASERSHKSNDGRTVSEEEVEIHEEEEDDEEEEAQGGQEDGPKAVVTWTEDDKKNLMDVGTSEMERNQWLENLIAKRRARKIMRLEAEKNLIDLDTNDPPFQIAPILTKKHNPFDLPYDSNEDMGLPPIPGSAPSVLLPRRNPFDLPYEPLEEKSNPMKDSFQQESMALHRKDMHFRRHESFSLGPSLLGELNQEKQNTKFRPYFVTERVASEGMEYPIFQRQSSDKSDSKASSAPETDSLSLFANQEYHKKIVEQEFSQESELISHIDCVSDNVERENDSSEVDLFEIDQKEKKDVNLTRNEIKEVDKENANEMDLGSPVEPYTRELHMNPEVVEEKSNGLSSSSSSEDNEMNTDERLESLEPTRNDCSKSGNSKQPSLTASESNQRSRVVEEVDDSQTKEPVYDSSPYEIEKTLSNMTAIEEALFFDDKGVHTPSFFIASDMQVEISEMGSPPLLVEETSSPIDAKPEINGSINKEMSSVNEGPWASSSHLCSVDEMESRSREVAEVSEHDLKEFGISGVHQNSDYPNALMVRESVKQASIDSSLSSSEIESGEEGLTVEEANFHLEQDQITSSSYSPKLQVRDHLDPVASSYSDGSSPDDLTSSALEKPLPLMEKCMVQPPSDSDIQEPQISISNAAIDN